MIDKIVNIALTKPRKVIIPVLTLYLLLLSIFLISPPKYNTNFDLIESESKKVADILSGNGKNEVTSKIITLNRNENISFLEKNIKDIKGVTYFKESEVSNLITYSLNIQSEFFKESSKEVLKRVSLHNKGKKIEESIGLQGEVVRYNQTPKQSIAEIIGILISLILLYKIFGKFKLALIPICISILSLLGGLFSLSIVSRLIDVPDFALMMLSLLALGVGIDYSLFILSRHKHNIKNNMDKIQSIKLSYSTSGRAVFFAGVTVIISLLGILISNVPFLTGLAISSSLGVVFTLINTFTLLPIILKKVKFANDGEDIEKSNFWEKWSRLIERRKYLSLIIGGVVILSLLIPSKDLRLGGSDGSLSEKNSPEFITSKLVEKELGRGFIDPFLIILPKEKFSDFEIKLKKDLRIISNTEVYDKVVLTVINDSYSHTKKSDDDLAYLREYSKSYNGLVGGSNAVYKDIADDLRNKLITFFFIVLIFSGILILVIFRSLVIMFKAIIMNILTALSSFGVLAIVFQYGWLKSLLQVEGDIPLLPFLPILLLAILFGLAMDYQVFLLSRIKEEYDLTKENSLSVAKGLQETGRVITAAALIMIAVFLSFAFTPDLNIKMAGVALSSAIFIDAFIIRSLMVPALMHILGKNNWYIPKFLEKLTPKIKFE